MDEQDIGKIFVILWRVIKEQHTHRFEDNEVDFLYVF
jgi:hypothetical protein